MMVWKQRLDHVTRWVVSEIFKLLKIACILTTVQHIHTCRITRISMGHLCKVSIIVLTFNEEVHEK